MELRIASLMRGDLGVDLLAMPRGDHHLEVVEPGEAVAFLVFRGTLSAVYQGPTKLGRRRVQARRGLPLILMQPGTYAIYAETNIVGLRGVRGANDR